MPFSEDGRRPDSPNPVARVNLLCPTQDIQPRETMVLSGGCGRDWTAISAGRGPGGVAGTAYSVVNLSTYKLSPDEINVLSMGISIIPSPGPNKFCNNTLVEGFNKTLEKGYIGNYRHRVPMASGRVLDRVCEKIEDDLSLVSVRPIHPNLS